MAAAGRELRGTPAIAERRRSSTERIESGGSASQAVTGRHGDTGDGDGDTHQQAGAMRFPWDLRHPPSVSPAPAESVTADCPSLSRQTVRLCQKGHSLSQDTG